MLSSVIETDYEPSTRYTQTFQKPGITGNQQGSEKQKYSAPNSTQFHPSHVISVGKVTVENIVKNCEKKKM